MKITTKFVPAFTSTLLARITLSIGVSAVAIAITPVVVPQPAAAQTAGSVQPLQDFTNPQNERDSFGGDIGGSGGLNVFNMIHNAQLGGWRDPNDVASEQRNSLDKATAEFRRRQLQQLGNPQIQQSGNQQPTSPANSPTTSPTSN